MPNKNIQNKKDDKNYHAKMKLLEIQWHKLGKHLNRLCQQEKAIQSAKPNITANKERSKDIRDKIEKLQWKIQANMIGMVHLKEVWEREVYRRKHCKVPSNRCPICPMRSSQ